MRVSKNKISNPPQSVISFFSFNFDQTVILLTFVLLCFGVLMVASASMVISDRQFGYPFHYLLHQVIYLVVGVVMATVTLYIPMQVWQKISIPFMLFGLFLLVIVLIPGIGHVVNGSRRWIILGIFSLQVSEIVKLSALIYLSSYLQRYLQQVRTDFIGFLKPIMLLGIISVLLLCEPDFGAVAVLSMMFLALLFISGVRLWSFSLLFLLIAFALALLALTSPYRLQRLTTFLNPWNVQFGSGYQLTQSLIAFGRGGLLGVGLGNSIQKLFYLPEAHTDFLFAVIAEELGLLGSLVLIFLFAWLVFKIFLIGKQAEACEDLFQTYVCYGAAIWIGLQSMINIGVNAGVLPTKGLTLPFISYGGSSMLVNCILIGIVLRIAHEAGEK